MPHARTVLRHTMALSAPPERIFPLRCPTREHDRIESWRRELLYSDSGVAERDCVFRTDFPDDGPADTWAVCRHDPPSVIDFVRVNPLRSIRDTITLRGRGFVPAELAVLFAVAGLDVLGMWGGAAGNHIR